jgi:long-chain acyl-CoA synthetase
MEVRVVDAAGRELPRGEVGEIVSRGTCLMAGYWNLPDETAAALRDGWLHSGDAGYVDDEGFIFLLDRVKDMIVSGGENVYSTEVENAISKHPDVATCAVIGIPHEHWGEAVHAIVVLKRGCTLTAEALRAYCKTLIANYKCPTSVEFRDQIASSGPGKPLKYTLREPFWRGRDRHVG